MKLSGFQRLVFTLLAVVVALFATFVWPTQYRYDHWHQADSDWPVRINRFTGHAEVLLMTGWTAMPP